jgi:hypothetical protein
VSTALSVCDHLWVRRASFPSGRLLPSPGPYEPNEQEAAIRSHARYFYEGEPEVFVDAVCRTVTNAAVDGLPMHQV